eukprot:scaffold6832_cov81-Skeletonema_menzelii.AAC.38
MERPTADPDATSLRRCHHWEPPPSLLITNHVKGRIEQQCHRMKQQIGRQDQRVQEKQLE